jgi:hypothetical protein
MFLKKYKEQKKAENQKQTDEYLTRKKRSVRIGVLKKELGIVSCKPDEDFFEELFTILKTTKDRLDSLEETNKSLMNE